MILSSASIEHGLLTLAAMLIGAPVVPVSPAYSLLPEARPRLHDIAALIQPAFVFVQADRPFEPVRGMPDLASAIWISATGGPAIVAISDWYALTASEAVWRRREAAQQH